MQLFKSRHEQQQRRQPMRLRPAGRAAPHPPVVASRSFRCAKAARVCWAAACIASWLCCMPISPAVTNRNVGVARCACAEQVNSAA